MARVKIGVVGLGMVAQIMHLPYLLELEDDYEVGAVCDVSPGLLNKVGDFYHIENRYRDFNEMIAKAELDAVLILTFYHADVAAASARAGLHILCEKPMSFSPQEAEEVMKEVDKAGVKFMVAYMKRYDEGYLFGLEKIRAMKDVRIIRSHDACFQNDLAVRSMYDLWKFDDIDAAVARAGTEAMNRRITEALGPDAPRNVRDAYRLLLETASHDITVLRGAFGDPKGVLFTEIWPRGNFFLANLDYGDETRCVMTVGRTARNWADEELTAYGMRDTVSIQFPNPFHRNEATVVEVIAQDGDATIRSRIEASHSEAFKRELKHFAHCVRTGEEPLTNGGQGLIDTELMARIILAAKV